MNMEGRSMYVTSCHALCHLVDPYTSTQCLWPTRNSSEQIQVWLLPYWTPGVLFIWVVDSHIEHHIGVLAEN